MRWWKRSISESLAWQKKTVWCSPDTRSRKKNNVHEESIVGHGGHGKENWHLVVANAKHAWIFAAQPTIFNVLLCVSRSVSFLLSGALLHTHTRAHKKVLHGRTIPPKENTPHQLFGLCVISYSLHITKSFSTWNLYQPHITYSLWCVRKGTSSRDHCAPKTKSTASCSICFFLFFLSTSRMYDPGASEKKSGLMWYLTLHAPWS